MMAGRKARRGGGFAARHYTPPTGGGGGGFPDATNTGYLNAPGQTGLTAGSTPITSNTTYNFKQFTSGFDIGSTGTPASNVTFNGCLFKSASDKLIGLFGDNITFNYCSFEPLGSFVPDTRVTYANGYQYGLCGNGSFGTFVQKLTVDHCDMWGFGNAIDINGSTQAKPQVFTNNWIHDARQDGGIDHTDGIGQLSGAGTCSYIIVDHNTIESPGNTNGLAFQQGVYDHTTITNNYFGGFGFCVAVWQTNTYTTFTDNVFSTKILPVFGPCYPHVFATTTGSLWRRNKWKVPAGAAWGNPAHDGWFWQPGGDDASSLGWSDNTFVSLTDFTG
jgi:hypothetical protein